MYPKISQHIIQIISYAGNKHRDSAETDGSTSGILWLFFLKQFITEHKGKEEPFTQEGDFAMDLINAISVMYEWGAKLYIGGKPATPKMVEEFLNINGGACMPVICYDENGSISEIQY